MTFGIFIVYKYAEIITHFGDFVNREWEWLVLGRSKSLALS